MLAITISYERRWWSVAKSQQAKVVVEQAWCPATPPRSKLERVMETYPCVWTSSWVLGVREST